MKRPLLVTFVLVFLLLAISISLSTVTAQSRCLNAAGRPIPCPTSVPSSPNNPNPDDRDGDGTLDSQDRCPDNGGLSWNACCPVQPDKDGDGTPDAQDRCHDAGGPSANGGYPAGDRDHDTVIDTQDRCPDQAGLPQNGGCPVDLPTTGDCILTTVGIDRIKVHAKPELDSKTVRILDPGKTYTVSERQEQTDGAWYRTDQGWVSANLVRMGGSCHDRSPQTVFQNPNLNFGCPALSLYPLYRRKVMAVSFRRQFQ